MAVAQDRNRPSRHRPEGAEEVIAFFVGAHRRKEEGHGGKTVVQVEHGQPYEFFKHSGQHCRSGINPVTAAAPLSSAFHLGSRTDMAVPGSFEFARR